MGPLPAAGARPTPRGSRLARRSALLLTLLAPACVAFSDGGIIFDPTEVTVRVTVEGNGGGRVSAPEPVSISCSKVPGTGPALGLCTNTFTDAGGGGSFALDMEADPVSVFVAWSGDCSGDVCALSFPGRRDTTFTVTARFILQPPTAAIEAPADGTAYPADATIRFTGSGTNAAGAGVFALVWTSSVDGTLCDTPFGCATFERTLSPGRHTITLTAADAEGTEGSTAVTVEVLAEPFDDAPVAELVSPPDGATIDDGQEVRLSGLATDAEDGTLAGEALVFTSSVDGVLGNGGNVVRTLSAGTHVLTLVATDSGGNTGSDTHTVTVVRAGVPGEISGVVTLDGDPVADALVALNEGGNGTTRTVADGSYAFPRLPAGTYSVDLVDVSVGTFAEPTRTVSLDVGGAATVDFAGSTTSGSGTGSISGRVTGNGFPIGGATLTLTGPVSSTTASGSTGTYAFTDLPAGTYTVSVMTELNVTFPAPTRTVTLAAGQALTVDFAGTY